MKQFKPSKLPPRSSYETLEFTFEGTQEQFDFFKESVDEKLEGADLKLLHADGKEFRCSVNGRGTICFAVGMLVGMCYTHFEFPDDPEFNPKNIGL